MQTDMTGHVKFLDDADEKIHEGEIKIQTIDDNSIRFVIGFLQCFHKYRLTLNVPYQIRGPVSTSGVDSFGSILEGADMHGDSTTVHISVHIGHLKGTVENRLVFTRDGRPFTIVLHANILGPEEGTPYLKTGVKMIEAMHPDEVSAVSTN